MKTICTISASLLAVIMFAFVPLSRREVPVKEQAIELAHINIQLIQTNNASIKSYVEQHMGEQVHRIDTGSYSSPCPDDKNVQHKSRAQRKGHTTGS